ncbi:MAG: helix-turn-helix domain-containing protein, partial [Planctomycetales bacterium]|nr:helix-turn-helix domain-containing protein [Planctomycetales bacterium]
MRSLLNRSPKEEILRVQIENAKQLLLSTNLSAVTIAQKCGFAECKYFSQVFRAKV